MDLWADIYLGKRWTDDDGTHHRKPEHHRDIHITFFDELPVTLKNEFAWHIWRAFKEIMQEHEIKKKYGTKLEHADG